MKMENDFITKQCERCDEEIRLPGKYTETSNIAKLCQVNCTNGCKTHTFDFLSMKWWR